MLDGKYWQFAHRWVGPLLAAMLAGCTGESPSGAPELLELEITGSDYNWYIHYPGSDGALGTRDDVWALQHLHLPANVPVVLRLLSRDFLYNFWLPRYDIYEIAVPDVPMQVQFNSGEVGNTQLLGDQMCGFSHEDLIGRLVVMERGAFEDWLDRQKPLNEPIPLSGQRSTEGGREG